MANSVLSDYAAIVTVRHQQPINTTSFFDLSYTETNESPIDQFFANCLQLNRHWTTLQPNEELTPDLGILLLLGYVSAVEGYMRALLRKLIHCDPYCQHVCESQQVSYGAVLHHRKDVLPDALLEETVFSSGKNISGALSKFIGFDGLSTPIKQLIGQFDDICQLRHCCVHRFGKLGAKNATALGLSTHGRFLEKPVVIKKNSIAEIADLMFTLVKSINNETFGFVMKRAATAKPPGKSGIGIGWTWNKRNDRARFQTYYSIFASVRDATPSPPADAVYEMFRATHKSVGRRR